MYPVLIVDDEQLIRQGLSHVIDWEEEGFLVAAMAQNYEDAILEYERVQPLLLLTDIRMPGPDGLSLIETLKTNNPDIKVLVLSGHADFSYAQRALRSRVDGYLLKPVDEEELLASLREIKKQLDATKPMDKPQKMLENMVRGLAPAPGALAKTQGAGLLGPGPWQVLLFELRDGQTNSHAVLRSAVTLLDAHMTKSQKGLCFMLESTGALFLFSPWTNRNAIQSLQKDISQVLNHNSAPQSGGGKLSMALSMVFNTIEFLPMAVEEARKLLARAFFHHGEIIHEALIQAIPNSVLKKNQDLPGLVQTLAYQLDAQNQKDFETTTDQCFLDAVQAWPDELGFKTYIIGLGTLLLDRWTSLHPENKDKREAASLRLAGFFQASTAQELTRQFKEELWSFWQGAGPVASSQLAERLEAIIQSHFADPLHLDELARAFGYNSAYLGKLFKQGTGKSFNTRLDEVRIDKAKVYLSQGLKVQQVAKMVGYKDPEYFLAKFKKIMGLSPRAWKSQN